VKDRLTEELLAMRAAQEIKPGDYCNLGIGLPQLCASHVPEGAIVQAENGTLGYGPLVDQDNVDKMDLDFIDAGGSFFTTAPGMAFFDILTSFMMIRSGRLKSFLGGLQVSERGDLAIHSLSSTDKFPQIGGSMDLAWGAKRLIVLMTHNTKDGVSKIVKDLTLPMSARACVDLIITDLAVIEVTSDGLVLREHAPGWTPHEVQTQTDAQLIVATNVKEIEF
jgi:3-oxoacid CoA-transferase subunit B